MSGKDKIRNKGLADKIHDHVSKSGSGKDTGKPPVSAAQTMIQHEHIKQKQIVRQSCLKVAVTLVSSHPAWSDKAKNELVSSTIDVAQQFENWVYGTEAG